MPWTLADLDFPVLLLAGHAGPPSLTSLGGGDVEGLYEVGVSYGNGRGARPQLTLRTLACRGRRIDSSGHAG